MKLNFCTLFNASYLSRGLVMYESLVQYCSDFHLYIFAFDESSLNYLSTQKFEHLTVVSLKDFEDEDLLKIKPSRTAGEYCWTCTSSTILYSINKFGLENCTYLDADLLFFSDPRVLIEELGDDSVLITEHRYTEKYDQSLTSGKYCVQFVTFKNDERGMKVLNWWREKCIEWCYAYVEDGKFGDQKYLDDWTVRFDGVHELKHLGGGIAPWNVQQYLFEKRENKLIGIDRSNGLPFVVVFFHFHGVKFYDKDIVSISHAIYEISDSVKTIFYFPYIRLLNTMKRKVSSINNSFDSNGNAGTSPMEPINIKLLLRFYISDLRISLTNIFARKLKQRVQQHYYYFSGKL